MKYVTYLFFIFSFLVIVFTYTSLIYATNTNVDEIRTNFVPNKLITLKELPDGLNYFRTFAQRAVKPLVDHFGKEPHQLIDAAIKLGGYKVNHGDAAVTINAFRRVPITIVLWQGDDEFPPAGSVMFDSSISDYLSCYDITELCETIAWKLVRSHKQR